MSRHVPDEFKDLEQKRASHQRWFHANRPKRIDGVIAQVVQRKGYAQVRAAGEWEEAWRTAAGEMAGSTCVGSLRRGVLEIVASNSLVIQELSFRKEELLARMQDTLPEKKIRQLRFRIGEVN